MLFSYITNDVLRFLASIIWIVNMIAFPIISYKIFVKGKINDLISMTLKYTENMNTRKCLFLLLIIILLFPSIFMLPYFERLLYRIELIRLKILIYFGL